MNSEELKRNNTLPPLAHQSDSDSDAVFSSDPEDEPMKVQQPEPTVQPEPVAIDDDRVDDDDRVIEELEFPSQIPTSSSSKLTPAKSPTKSPTPATTAVTPKLKRSKLVAPESPPKSPIFVSNKTVRFGKLPKIPKRSFSSLQGNSARLFLVL